MTRLSLLRSGRTDDRRPPGGMKRVRLPGDLELRSWSSLLVPSRSGLPKSGTLGETTSHRRDDQLDQSLGRFPFHGQLRGVHCVLRDDVLQLLDTQNTQLLAKPLLAPVLCRQDDERIEDAGGSAVLRTRPHTGALTRSAAAAGVAELRGEDVREPRVGFRFADNPLVERAQRLWQCREISVRHDHTPAGAGTRASSSATKST